jgi:hypothetical protein
MMPLTSPLTRFGYGRIAAPAGVTCQPGERLLVLLVDTVACIAQGQRDTAISPLPTVWILSHGGLCSAALCAAMDAGCAGVLLSRDCGIGVWGAVLARTEAQSAHAVSLSRLAEVVGPRMLSVIRSGVIARRTLDAEVIAHACGMSPGELSLLFRQEGFSSASDGLRWIRLQLAADVLDHSRTSSAPFDVSWLGSREALRKLMSRLVPRSAVGHQNGDWVVARLRARLTRSGVSPA